MNLQQNIADILQQYEFAMAIGDSLDYFSNCDYFLKRVLAKKNLSSCWIIKPSKEEHQITYSYPLTLDQKTIAPSKILATCFENEFYQFPIQEATDLVWNTPLCRGSILFFNLKSQGGLFFHSETRQEYLSREIEQLRPIIDKFILSLEACESFSKRELLLKKLETQNQELKDYAHAVSHDLKSPLRNINTLINWIKEDHKTEQKKSDNSHFDLIDKNLEKMDNLISGILEYSLVDKTQSKSTWVNLQKIVSDTIMTSNKKETTSIFIKNQLPTIQSDSLRMSQLFQNLISNAINSIEDGHTGMINIDVEEQKDYWLFSIEDNGRGIEEKYFEKIFEIFQSIDQNPESIGIGLSIVQKIIDFYQGKIWLTSEPKKGTTFYFTLKK